MSYGKNIANSLIPGCLGRLLCVALPCLLLAGCMTKYTWEPPESTRKTPPPPPVVQAPPPAPVFYVDASKLNLRACPGMDCPKVGTLERNAEVEKLSEFEDWVQVRARAAGTVGWVNSRYLSAAPVPAPKPEEIAPPVAAEPPPPKPAAPAPAKPADKPPPAKAVEKPAPAPVKKVEEKKEPAPKPRRPSAAEAAEDEPAPAPVRKPVPTVSEPPARTPEAPAAVPTPPKEPPAPATPPAEQPKRIRIM